MERPTIGIIDYQGLLQAAVNQRAQVIEFLRGHLPYACRDAYIEMTAHSINIIRWHYGSFEYIFDDYAPLELRGAVPEATDIEARLVAVLGCSDPKLCSRDDYRLKGWLGPTEKVFGPGWDKGHYIAHTIGGAVDGIEANVFIQRRDLNRGWSASGKRYRQMENYCVTNPGTFCFSRPIYLDQTARPAFVEFGVLKEGRELWLECFDNRL
jgi:hypothetical protein